ncbi:hypothetical protein AURDEDRAFT_157076 [Auricularia subglabra TFB-10046 SS5]|nr:hypothetical protein AURDEDRAFT_157076 [Auricularia subglabra TFB-10046 SS5]
MSKLLPQVPRASVEDRVWSFVVDQRKRIPQYASDGRRAHDDTQDDAEIVTRPLQAQLKINGSPMLQPRVPLPGHKPHKRVNQENTKPASCAASPRPDEPKKRKAKPPKICVKNERTKEDADAHVARLTERRERRRAKREILKPKETVQEEDYESNVSDNKARKKSRTKSKKATALPAGLALMNSFSSRNVTRDRLTLRSEPRSAGMFSKGKSSAKVKTRMAKSASKCFDEHAFLNKSRPRSSGSSDSESSTPAVAYAAQRSRFFRHSAEKDLEDPVRKKQHVEQEDESEEDHDSAPSDDKPVGPVSEIWSIEREFLEPEAQKSRREALARDAKPADDVRSLYTMNTQYRLRLPMCANIAAYVGPSQPFMPSVPVARNTDESSHPASSTEEASQARQPEDSTQGAHEQVQQGFELHGHAEDAAGELLFSPYSTPPDTYARAGDIGPPRDVHAARAASFQPEDLTSDRLLDDLDYLLETHHEPPEVSEWATQYSDRANTADDAMDADDNELLSWDGDDADTWMNRDDDVVLVEPGQSAPMHAVQVDRRYDPLISDESRVAWHPEMGCFVTTAQEGLPTDGEQINWVFEHSGAANISEDDGEEGYTENVGEEEMFVDEDSDSSESEAGYTSMPEAAGFTEGRSLLMGLGSRPAEQDIQFEWHPYRLG